MEKKSPRRTATRKFPQLNHSKTNCFAVLFSLVFFTLANTSIADSTFKVIIDVLEDSYVDSNQPETNHGTEDVLRVSRWGFDEQISYLKFDLGRIPEGKTILSAKLNVYGHFVYYDPVVTCHYLDDDGWDEETITWNNSPQSWEAEPSDTVAPFATETYFDVTDEVILAYNDDGTISLVLRMQDDIYYSLAYFFSSRKMSLDEFWPVLEVEVAGQKYGGGQGTESDPYLIYTAEQLSWIGDNPNDFSSHFELMSDIDLSEYTGHEFPIISNDWTAPFEGIFEGNFHVISNFTFTPVDGFNYTGLFGAIGPNSVVRNLGLTEPNVDCEGNGTGSLAGLVKGLVESCWATSVNIHGGFRIGGLIGQVSDGFVRNCYVDSGNVSVEYNYAGGFVGENDANIVNCYSVCAVAGPGTWLGGFVGNNQYGELTACFYNEDVTGNVSQWGAIASNTEAMRSMRTFTDEGWDFVGETVNGSDDVWNICSGFGYPVLWWQDINCPAKYGGGSGTQEDPYQIHTAEQLNLVGASIDDWDKYFVLMNDLDLSDFNENEFNLVGDTWTEPFTGVFNGNGHTIANLSYSTTDFYNYMGLWGCIGVGGVVENLGLIRPSLHGGANGTGALTGILQGTVRNCWAVDVNISGSFRSGGLVGEIYGEYGKLLDSYVDGGEVSVEYNYGGGLVGENTGQIICCYSTACVDGNGWPQCGLVGDTDDGGQVIASFWDITVSGEGSSDGGTPLNTAQMKSKTVFLSNGWDFIGEITNGLEDTWRMCVDGNDYPRLQCQYRPADLDCPDGVDISDLVYFAHEWLMQRLSSNVDYNADNFVNMLDWAVFSLAWSSTPTSPNWNKMCDIAPKGGDDVIDEKDLRLFTENWLISASAYVKADIAPRHKTDAIVNLKDFAKLAEEWLSGGN